MRTTQSERRLESRGAITLIEQEHRVLTHTNDALIELAANVQGHANAAVAAMLKMKAHLEAEGVHGKLNRRDIPGLRIRNFNRDLSTWLVEYVTWKLGLPVTSSFKVFQCSSDSLSALLKQDVAHINAAAANMKAQAERGW